MNKHGKTVDKTYLSVDQAEERGFIHRDYIAHCLRWSHVVKRLCERKRYQEALILDVGCGRELPLAKLLYSSKLLPLGYTGVDVGPIEDAAVEMLGRTGKFHGEYYEHQDICDLPRNELAQWNVVVCFEVLEHVEPEHVIRILKHLREIVDVDCTLFFSTPCWNVTDCAANHVNEMRYSALGSVFENMGFEVLRTYGTFASIRDYEHLLHDCCQPVATSQPFSMRDTFNALREYYDTNFLSCVFAPLFPAQSRNALWELSLRKGKGERQFPSLAEVPAPWSSSERWMDLKGSI